MGDDAANVPTEPTAVPTMSAGEAREGPEVPPDMGTRVLPTFDLRLTTPFVILGEELHFGRAALRLGVAQPALSQQIGRLERQLGVKLFARGARGVTLTSAGARFLVESRAIVHRAGDIEQRLRHRPAEFRVHVGPADNPLVRGVVASFTADHPQVGLRLTEGPGTEGMRALARGEVNAAFHLPGGAPDGSTFLTLDRSPLGVACAADHPLASRSSAAWRGLAGERVFVAPVGIADAWNQLVRESLRINDVDVAELVGPRVNRAQYLAESIRAGTALLIAPDHALNPLPQGVAWTVLHPVCEYELGVVFSDHDPNDALPAFIDHVKRFSPWVKPVGTAPLCSTSRE